MKFSTFAGSSALFIGMALQAGPACADISALYDNTMVSYHADGHVHKMYFNRDGTFQVKENGITFVSGTYTYKADGDLICMKTLSRSPDPGPQPSNSAPRPPPPAAPANAPNRAASPACQPLESNHKIGVFWTHKGPNGAAQRNVIVRGRDP